ncbi:RraA family protein [Tropicimonas sp. TH_r6]|uniref:RraA family protein n=1 Tax=Tropicimonas sp. TH_r6 TaxID=3082085 RepID=UPI00295432B2|nr:RraA family protein [Tropicimonas sp. TH_r6]MDV7143441.1 RraA family protein [Tropicimonas sp. TH_r6]
MIEAPPKLTIRKDLRRPSEAQIAAFQGVATGFVVDAMFGAGALSLNIQPLGGGQDLDCNAAGTALTAECGAGDVLAVFASLKFIRPGDVVVSSFAAHSGCAAGGDGLVGMMKNCGAAGFVTDGPLRDYPGLVSVGLPVWCTGITPASPHMSGPGAVGFPIQIGAQEVETGDMIVADRDGVVVVPFERLDEVIEQLERIKAAELAQDQKVVDGMRVPEWVEHLLASDEVAFRE